MLPLFVFIALPTLSFGLWFAILCRKFAAFVLYRRTQGQSRRRAMSRFEALQLLGLNHETDPRTIRSAYKSLMIEHHPDHGGTHQTAAKLNQARDVLLRVRKIRAA